VTEPTETAPAEDSPATAAVAEGVAGEVPVTQAAEAAIGGTPTESAAPARSARRRARDAGVPGATGRRKQAIARVRLSTGGGRWMVNGRPLDGYFPNKRHQQIVSDPLTILDVADGYDVVARVHGGGVSGQAGALRLAVARALADVDPERRSALKRAGFLTRDARAKERKKYGLKKARKAPQYSKR
jgi:small subunit ribosomal protein S9